MFELTINGEVYSFRFGMGFVRAINGRRKISGENGEKQDAGLQYAVASLMDGNVIDLVDILDLANKTESPRVKREQLDAYIEDESTDIEQLFADLLDFFAKCNSTKKAVETVTAIVEQQKAKAEKGE